MLNKITNFQPFFGSQQPKKLNASLQKLVDSVDKSMLHTQALRDSFESIGTNQKPVVAVIDSFNKKFVDINGDEIKDLSHGETVSLYTSKDANVLPVNIDNTDSDTIAQAIKSVFDAVKAGANIKAINVSVGLDISQDQYKGYLLPMVEKSPGDTFKDKLINLAENCYKNKEQLELDKKDPKFMFHQSRIAFQILLAAIYPDLKMLKDLPDVDLPVYFAPGNDKEKLDIQHFMFDSPNVIGPDKNKDSYAQTYNREEQSLFAVAEISDDKGLIGYDIDEDNRVDVLKEEVSQGKPILKDFIGKHISECVADNEFMSKIRPKLADLSTKVEALKETKKKIYSLKDAQKLFRLNPAEYKDFGQYVVQSVNDNFYYFNRFHALKANDDGIVYYDTNNKQVDNAVFFVDGTSFASPHAIKKDIQAGIIK